MVATVISGSLRQLDASVGASEPHDFAVRLTCCSSKAPSASTASRPAFVTIASRPSVGRDGGVYKSDLGPARTEMFLQMGLDSPNQIDPVEQIPLCAQMAHRAGYETSAISLVILAVPWLTSQLAHEPRIGVRRFLIYAAALLPAERGRITLNSVNSPASVSTSMDPPCCLTTMS